MSTSEPSLVTPATLRGWALPEPDGGKEARGQLLVVGGSSGTPGAVRLAGEAGLRAGAGKLALATAGQAAPELAIAVPEAQVVPLPTTAEGDISPHAAPDIIERADAAEAILLGPGFVDPTSSSQLVAGTLSRIHGRVVLDATASAYLTDRPDGCHHLRGMVVLTVNPDELALTAGWARDDVPQIRPGLRSTWRGVAESSSLSGVRARRSSVLTAVCGESRAAARGWVCPDPVTSRPGSLPGCWLGAQSRHRLRSGGVTCTHAVVSVWPPTWGRSASWRARSPRTSQLC